MFQHLPRTNALSHSEPFTRHGTPKLLQASVRRPGNRRMNLRQPSCTKAEARSHASYPYGTRRGDKQHEAWVRAQRKA